MNKSDIKLLFSLLIVILLFMVSYSCFSFDKPKNALVYYDNELVLKIALDREEEYTVVGFNGPVKIVTAEGKIKVKEETSPLHLCSHQGWIDKPYEVIVCLPNKIMIKIEAKNEEIDTIVR